MRGPGLPGPLGRQRGKSDSDVNCIREILDTRTKTAVTLDGPICAISPDATMALAPDFRRLQDLRPGYGYAGFADPNAAVGAPTDAGIWRIDLTTGKLRLFESLAEVADIPHTDPWPAQTHHWVNHPAAAQARAVADLRPARGPTRAPATCPARAPATCPARAPELAQRLRLGVIRRALRLSDKLPRLPRQAAAAPYPGCAVKRSCRTRLSVPLPLRCCADSRSSSHSAPHSLIERARRNDCLTCRIVRSRPEC